MLLRLSVPYLSWGREATGRPDPSPRAPGHLCTRASARLPCVPQRWQALCAGGPSGRAGPTSRGGDAGFWSRSHGLLMCQRTRPSACRRPQGDAQTSQTAHAPRDAGEIGHDTLEVLVGDVAEGRIVWEGDDRAAVAPPPTCGESRAPLSWDFSTTPRISPKIKGERFSAVGCFFLGKEASLKETPGRTMSENQNSHPSEQPPRGSHTKWHLSFQLLPAHFLPGTELNMQLGLS